MIKNINKANLNILYFSVRFKRPKQFSETKNLPWVLSFYDTVEPWVGNSEKWGSAWACRTVQVGPQCPIIVARGIQKDLTVALFQSLVGCTANKDFNLSFLLSAKISCDWSRYNLILNNPLLTCQPARWMPVKISNTQYYTKVTRYCEPH